MSKPPILLIGNCIIDQIYRLACFPSEDDELRALEHTRELGGNACNSVRVLAALGHPVALGASLADDDPAAWARARLASLHIGTHACQTLADHTTPHSSIWLNTANGSRTIVHHRDLPEMSAQHLRGLSFADYDWIHFEGRNIATLQEVLPLLDARRERLSLEIEKARPGIEDLARSVGTLIVSSHYLRDRGMDAATCMDELKKLNPHALIVCTLGAQGLSAIDADGRKLSMPAERVDRVIDTIGAGDCFIAGLISRLSLREPFANALDFANHLAAIKIQRQGMTIE